MGIEVQQIERLVALLSVGVTVAIERGVFTIDEASNFVFSPHAMRLLRECGGRAAVIDMVHRGTEVEDIASLMPEMLASELVGLREEALSCLEDAGQYPFNAEKWLSALTE